MTAQTPEILIIDGERHAMRAEPLEEYFALTGHRPSFSWPSTACFRGYIGTWSIIDDRLYLVDFEGWRPDRSKMTLTDLFPQHSGKVLADWFSGKVELPTGKLLHYIHLGYASIYEKDIILKFRNGVLLSRRMRNNWLNPLNFFRTLLWARL